MAKKNPLTLPAQASKDVKTVTSILDRWAVSTEDLIKDVFAWGKQHKVLVLVVIGFIALKRYWLDDEANEDEGY